MKIDSKRLERLLKAVPGELSTSLGQAAGRVGQRFLGFHRARRMRGPPGVQATRAGLPTHFRYEVKGNKLENLTLDIGTRSRVALEHEEGRTIKARSGGALLVPLQLKGKEMSRRQLKVARAKLRSGQLVEITSRKGQRFLGERKSKKGALQLLFAFVRQVKIPARLKFFETWRDYAPTAFKNFNQGVVAALAAAQRKARG